MLAEARQTKDCSMLTMLHSICLVGILLMCSTLLCQEKPGLIASFRDLKAGMSRDHVLAGLASHYKLEEEIEPPADPSKGWDGWNVSDGGRYVGEIFFQDGRLKIATLRLASSLEGAPRIIDTLFEAIYEQSGQSTINEGTGGDLSRSRSATVIIGSVEQTLAEHRIRNLNFFVGGKQFNLSVTSFQGERTVTLDEVVAK